MRTIRWLLIVVPLALLVVLAIYPGTGWLVRQHLWIPQGVTVTQLAFSPAAGNDEILARVQSRLKQTALRHPSDYLAQLSWAMSQTSMQASSQNLRALLPRFGDRPSLYAHILRYSTSSNVVIYRQEEQILAQGRIPDPTSLPPPPPPPPPEVLAEFDRIAREGERLDPDNAFFPMMRAVGYFAGKRDREAVQAILRASVKPRFDDYAHEEAQSIIHLYTLAYGKQPAIVQVGTCFSLFFPHYARLRAMVRMGQYMAMQADKGGRSHEAAEIRLALMRCGRLVRTQARFIIGSLLGITMVKMGGSLPRLQPPQSSKHGIVLGEPEDPWAEQNREFVKYLRRLGRYEDARWAERELRLAREVQALFTQAVEQHRIPVYNIAIASASVGAISMTLLTMGLSTLLFGLIWQVLSRLVSRLIEAMFAMVLALFVVGVILWSTPPVFSIIAYLHTISSLLDLTRDHCCLSTCSEPYMPLLDSLTGFIQTLIMKMYDYPNMLYLVGVLAFVGWLILLTAGITVVGILCKQSASEALIGGLRRYLLPAAAALLILCAGQLIYNAQVERHWLPEIEKVFQHESAYTLQLMGKQVPQ
ncbi:MAG: hypothetical protein HPY54_08175 [Chthonomonadetes bacterium]|nr:hypothetical protein [Chthonomonadetes bacterium]